MCLRHEPSPCKAICVPCETWSFGPPHVVEGAVAGAEGRGVTDGAGDVRFGRVHRAGDAEATSEVGGDGGGEGAAGAVGVGGRAARARELRELVTVVEQVDYLVAGEGAAG